MGSAKYQTEQLGFPLELSGNEAEDDRAELRQQVAEHLAAHRSRRPKQTSATSIPIAEPKPRPGRSNQIAAAVKERYAQSQSYRDFLAAEAERAIDEANAAAQVAARSAEAIEVAQQQLLAELEHWNDAVQDHEAQDSTPVPVLQASDCKASMSPASDAAPKAVIRASATGLTVKLYENVGLNHPPVRRAAVPDLNQLDDDENSALDEEIAFRRTPVFAAPLEPPTSIPANLIEFPRQLVAPRKARPRLAEGPLRDESPAENAPAQLRIFEVEATQIAIAPEPPAGAAMPVWASIRLDAVAPLPATHTTALPAGEPEPALLLPLDVAPLDLRLMAAAVDACLLGVAFLAAVSGFAYRAAVLPSPPVAVIAAVGTLLVLFILYHALFFTFSDATPGMRYARIGLCTFSDENPTRSQLRQRTWAILLAAAPLGLGFLWAWLDEDRLAWHDRISRMYQRSY